MSDVIDEIFDTARTYPGSTTPIPENVASAAAEVTGLPTVDEASDVETWGDPTLKHVDGEPVDLWGIGTLARVLGRSIPTVRLWEKNERLPLAPFRLQMQMSERGEQYFRRYYSARSLNNVIACAEEAGFYARKRVDWGSEEAHRFTSAVTLLWQQETSDYTGN